MFQHRDTSLDSSNKFQNNSKKDKNICDGFEICDQVCPIS